MTGEAVQVEQIDREAAAALGFATMDATEDNFRGIDLIRSGGADEAPLVQAFARHRLAALEQEREAYYASLAKCGERYAAMAHGHQIGEFIELFREGVRNRMSLGKLNRWLGYIQGTLIATGFTNVDKERDWTRPLFRPLDFPASPQPRADGAGA